MTDTLTWGLIGASDIAAKWVVPAINAQTDCRTQGVFSSNPERGRKYAAENKLPHSYATLDALLADDNINAVYISTTNELHKEQTLRAAAAGKHILCEKPLSLKVGDAIEMVRACEQAGVVMATNHHLRNSAAHIKVKELLKSGEVGDILAMRVFHAAYLPEHLHGWRLDSAEAGGGVILDIAVHDADTVRFHLEQDPTEVLALEQHSGLSKNRIEDGAMTLMKFSSGIIVSTHESFACPYSETGVEFYGNKGVIRARHIMTQQPVGEITLTNAAGERKIDFQPHSLYERAISLFTKATRGEGRPAADGMDGVKSLAIAIAAKESALSGKAVTVDYGIE